MTEISDKLRQLMANRGVKLGSQWRAEREGVEKQRQAGGFEIDKCVPGEVVENEAGSFYLVRTDFPLDTLQGAVTIGDIFTAAGEHIALSACDDELAAFDPASAVFIDIETTGLAGGAGTTAFLVGAGYFANDSAGCGTVFRLDQCFMRDFDDEEAMLAYLQGVFANAATVVTFNGKTFDIPLLRSRFVSNRLPFRLDAAMHYDLVHAVRRIFKLRLKTCTLSNVEREVLHVRRHGDIPGAEIPQVWLDYLRSRDARVLARVFNHHRNDIVSLVALASLIAQRLSVPCGDGFDHAEDRLSLVRLHTRRKNYEAVIDHAVRLIENEDDSFLRRECLSLLAAAYKRMQDWQSMQDVYGLMSREFPGYLPARLELAKFHEHRSRNLLEALRICQDAICACPAHDQQWMQDFQKRKTRIEKKLKRNPHDEEADIDI